MDEFGVKMDPKERVELRTDDFMTKTDTEKALQSTTQAAANTLNVYSIVTIVIGIAFDKSLVQVWNMIDSI